MPNQLRLSDKSVVSPGNYIVHEDHGIGIFQRISTRIVEAEPVTYAEIEYLNNDTLYVPSTQIEKLSKYIGVGRKKPRLNKLGGVAWKKSYKKVYDDVIKIARELLQVYARRELTVKKPRNINIEWDKEAVITFGFKETEDQKEAIKQVFNDLSNKRPMDRLVCGDVGFGKTEVALRAAVQTVANGYQVAILVPTTILAEQHYSTFCQRLSKLPINIGRLSRFVEKANQQETISRCEAGNIDILIGTHSIIRRNINFKNIGLVVIDEEQKFGVKDKENLKKYREHIDVLSLTATPIPRTLFMALSGLRDLSSISSVPEGRLPVNTEVGVFEIEKVCDYIKREIDRSGQVYYLHNKVSNISSVKRALEKYFPNLNISIAHGQMGEIALARTMKDFLEKRIDILVCSTIIENGLDMQNTNTLIVDDADNFGLSQLYQIRGRIGRSTKKAYALFTYRNKKISDNAFKRLRAMTENTELGSGYNIALEDLEIRGGGNILGREQHGSMETMGLILYSKLLSRAVEEMKRK
jgi:transcription-repair coupling factor (superfamily II helicase)